MARKNVGSTVYAGTTHEGAPARKISAELELRRSVMSCVLWESEFYESGETIAKRIARLVAEVHPAAVAQMAIDARSKMYLRHVPLLMVSEMARHATHRPYVRATLADVIQRADELAEFLAIYWGAPDRKQGEKRTLAKSVQRGLADAFRKFNAYQLAKYDSKDAPIKLRDVLFLAHAKPKDRVGIRANLAVGVDLDSPTGIVHRRNKQRHQEGQGATWTQLVEGTLPTPDTWEVELSAGKGEAKTESWTRLLKEKKLGGFALIRNLRNMVEAKVDDVLIRSALREMKPDRILPFRFLAAARIMPRFVAELEAAMLKNLAEQPKLPGMTFVLVDVSGSMDAALSDKSDMKRTDAGAGVAVFAREVCQSARVFTFSHDLVEVPAYRGLALVDAIQTSQEHGSTNTGNAVRKLNAMTYDRLIIITDEQSHTSIPGPNGKGYVINVASAKHGIGYGPWEHIDGFSERVLDYIRATENA